MLDVGVRCTLNTLDVGTSGRSDVRTFRHWTLDVGRWALGRCVPDLGNWTLLVGRWTLGRCVPDLGN